MTITQEEIDRFRQIWQEEYGEKISEDEARAHISRLDALYLFLARAKQRPDKRVSE